MVTINIRNMFQHSGIIKHYYFLLLLVCFGKIGVTQNVANVNLSTGAAQVSIPVGVVSSGDISFPITYYYSGGGVKVDDYGEKYGLGWSFSAEAGIFRQVKGFPDDVERNLNLGGTVKGWIRTGSAASAVDNFLIANDNNPNTCDDEVLDYNYINSAITDYKDTEPDIFNVNVPGLSFQFVFDKNKNIKVIPYKDVKIEYTKEPYTDLINSFTITNDKGFVYVFSNVVWSNCILGGNVDPAYLPAFKRECLLYNDAYVSYYSGWNLTSITDTKGNMLSFIYENTEGFLPTYGREKIQIVKYDPGVSGYVTQLLYLKNITTSTIRLKRILIVEAGVGSVNEPGLDFAYSGYKPTASLHNMQFSRTGTVVNLNVRGFNKGNDAEKPRRYFLKDISIASTVCATFGQIYKFDYYNVDWGENPLTNTTYCAVPDSITNAKDYWGYYNGQTGNANLIPPVWVYPDNPAVEKFKINPIPGYTGNEVLLPGANRNINSNATAGSLKRITYPQGGVTEVEYDNNEYFDSDVNSAVTGGGIRVRKITNNDGLNSNAITFYDYNDPLTNITTGKAISIPDFVITFPNNNTYGTIEEKVVNSTYRVIDDNYDERNQVIYGKVTVRKTSGGKTVYEFNTTGVRRGNNSGDWEESSVKVGRKQTSPPVPCTAIEPDFLVNGKNIYPYPANSNFDYERGLVKNIYNYNEAGNLVSEEAFTYTYANTQTEKIAALKFDDVDDVRCYSKYYILCQQDNLIETKIVKTYNSANPSSGNYVLETESFEYPQGTETYRLPKLISKLNSDGKTYKTRIRYAKDYITSGTGDDAEQGIHRLKQIGNNAIIETWQSVLIPNQVEKYYSGIISKFKKWSYGEFSSNVPLVYETYSFTEPDGVSTFTPSSITAGVLTMDSKYAKDLTVLTLNDDGTPGSAVDNSRKIQSTIVSFPENLKKLTIANARQEEVLYSSFDYDGHSRQFFLNFSTQLTKPGRYSTSCLTIQPGNTISGNIENATTNTNLVFSCWIQRIPPEGGQSDLPVTGSLTVNLSGSGINQNYSIPYSVEGTKWKYFEIKIPKPSATSFAVTVSTDVAIRLDDVMMYPGNAAVVSYSYTKHVKTRPNNQEINLGKRLTAETGLNGTTKYYEYANGAMPYIIRDADENIVQVNDWRNANQLTPLSIVGFQWNQPVQKNIPVTIQVLVNVPCNAILTYTWNFGDGTPQVVTAVSEVQHTYTSGGNFNVTCTLSAPGFTDYSYENNIAVAGETKPIICAEGVIEYNGAANSCDMAFCFLPHPTLNCNNTKFVVASVTNASTSNIANWVWEKAPVGTNNWTVVASGGWSLLNIPFSTTPPVTQSYKIRCTVTLANGMTGTSDEVYVMSY